MNGDTPPVVQDADAAYEAIRGICHASGTDPAPTVYRVLGNLKGATGHMLDQALRQLAAGLEHSLEAYDVYEDDGRDPAESVAAAAGHLRAAGALAAQLGEHLEAAQQAIARQGYR
ncbi:hypothetical protein [Sinomonas humi]|uniref:ESX-1 secretion-associated protein n=1 Tax=Sinomonas humi TaxID=1338436 RepID=A0A0B2AH11_9MICC|nr:hypothetical protein [Sinomonas humi]KHL02495.1 hypothetical protein LK10_12295 [Sinomonas humi]